jgi:hypothetical protein
MVNRIKSELQGWLQSATTTLLNHLRNCTKINDIIRARALAEYRERGTSSPRSCRYASVLQPPPNIDPSLLPPPNIYPSHLLIPGPSVAPGTQSWVLEHHHDPASFPLSPSISYCSLAGTDISGNLAPSDSVSSHGFSQWPNSQSRGLGQHRVLSQQPSWGDLSSAWTPAKWRSFETCLICLTVSSNLPFAWVDNPEWLGICDEFLPSAKPPSQKTLTYRLLPAAIAELRKEVKAAAKGHNATLQADGWTGENSHQLIAFMITTDGKVCFLLCVLSEFLMLKVQVRTVRVHNASAERKTAENLMKHLEEVMKTVHDEWGTEVFAVVTDASGESRKAQRLLGVKYPWLVLLDYYAHQVRCLCKHNQCPDPVDLR